MSHKFELGKDKVIASIVSIIKKKMSGDVAENCCTFVTRLLNTVALDDLLSLQVEDLYAACVNFWYLFYERQPSETKIRIYNPDYERHGWQTTHTVIEIVHDDMPFLVDSIRMIINHLGVTAHFMVHTGELYVKRDKESHKVNQLRLSHVKNLKPEAVVLIQIDRQTDPKLLSELHDNIERVLQDNQAMVSDWQLMRDKLHESIKHLQTMTSFIEQKELTETLDFLAWIDNHHFTYLGVRDYTLEKQGKDVLLKPIEGSGLGVLNDAIKPLGKNSVSAMSPEAKEFIKSNKPIVISKTNTRATVHRAAFTDYIGIKLFDKEGKPIGERRIIGLFTSAAYNTNPKYIPILRRKVSLVMEQSLLNPKSHAGKVFLNILDTLPRDDLIQGSVDELLEICMGIYHMQERRKIRMFARQDIHRRFISCLVFVPKDRFNTELRQAFQKVLSANFQSDEISFSTRFSDSVLARIHFVVRTNANQNKKWDVKGIEKQLIEVGRSWSDDLMKSLGENYGEELGNILYNKYKSSFPVAYKDNYTPRTAVFDVHHMEELSREKPLALNLFRPVEDISGNVRFKLYKQDSTVPLTEILPILEHLGLQAISERPYVLKMDNGDITWINDFYLHYTHQEDIEVDDIKELFQEAFANIWFGHAENDGFNQLVVLAGLNWRQVTVLRAYAKYFKQIGFTFSQEYIETALINQRHIAKKLISLFESRFAPEFKGDRAKAMAAIHQEVIDDLEQVSNLDEDKIIHQYLYAIEATLRTNYYQRDEEGNVKRYISIKLSPESIPGVPLPHPKYEIFVYSPRFEGVHLRCGKVARGGLRWSDRKEDFRTEILGLMKAQQVKNSVIVPSGAKGGFVPKHLPDSREEIMAEGIACYQSFIRGLLDISDNYLMGEVIKPREVICYDDDDPYLVVAADKGTATFSDIANAISAEYNFWLGDAFASGGSIGYDHKKMGITARGAWESVKRHFRELGRDIQTTAFTCIGIGDMAGDVFGNGMLLSEHTQLLGAFNHMHIFIDPAPDCAKSYAERKRLFNLPRSSWSDYEAALISKGGGIFERRAKYISVTPEIKQLFGIDEDRVEPNELIRYMLKAQVDLIWSGGIGTFVKSSHESNNDVGDRTNDAIRVDACELNCKVVGEGGNLGLTQLARVEFALNGGLIYTDFIDNSAGVDCSDNEVNIKILLNTIVGSGDLTEKQRNQILASMTDEVAQLVLKDNYMQTQAISLAAGQALGNIELHSRYLEELEQQGKLDRTMESLPDSKALYERKLSGKGLTRPGIAVLLCYSKTLINDLILASDVPEDPFLFKILQEAFPKLLQEKFSDRMHEHPLRREIIATKLSNIIVNEMGFTFVYRLMDETGASVSSIIKAYMIARTIFDLEKIWHEIQALDNKIESAEQVDMMILYTRLIRRSTRWFLRSNRMQLDISDEVDYFGAGVTKLKRTMTKSLGAKNLARYERYVQQYTERGVKQWLAQELAATRPLFSALDVIDVSHELNQPIEYVAEVYFGLGEFLDLTWIRKQVIAHPTENHWESLSREALRDDLDWQQKHLTAGIIKINQGNRDSGACIKTWAKSQHDLIERWKYMLTDLRSSSSLNYTMYFVAIRELLDLTQTCVQLSQKKEEVHG